MGIKEIFKPEHFNKLLLVLSLAVALVFVFTFGVFVGHEKARFSQRWGEHYYRNIMGPGGFSMMDVGRPAFNARGGLGQIIKIEGNDLIIRDQTNLEKNILVTDKTAIVKNNQTILVTGLKIDDKIVVIGRPNDLGQIETNLIRVLPPQPFGPERW